jgi:polyferredoxin
MPEWLKRLTKTDIRNTIALTIVYGVFIALFLLIYNPIPKENHDTVNVMIGFITGTALGGIMGFYFSSSKTDKKNDSEG